MIAVAGANVGQHTVIAQTFKDTHEVTDAMLHAFAAIRRAAGFSGICSDIGIAMPQATRVEI